MKLEDLKERLGADTILNELEQYLSTDVLNDFINHCSDMYDLEEYE